MNTGASFYMTEANGSDLTCRRKCRYICINLCNLCNHSYYFFCCHIKFFVVVKQRKDNVGMVCVVGMEGRKEGRIEGWKDIARRLFQ